MKNLRNIIQSLSAEKHSELDEAIESIVAVSSFNRAQRRKIKKFWDKTKQKKCVS